MDQRVLDVLRGGIEGGLLRAVVGRGRRGDGANQNAARSSRSQKKCSVIHEWMWRPKLVKSGLLGHDDRRGSSACTEARIASSSKGASVRRSITSTAPPCVLGEARRRDRRLQHHHAPTHDCRDGLAPLPMRIVRALPIGSV